MIINNTWNENILTTKACDIIKTPSETVVKSHTNKDYGKMLGIEYTKFETNNDIIRCTFQQKFAFKTFDMNFVKKITRHEDRVDITFQTVNSLVDMRGKWSVIPTSSGSYIMLNQNTVVPGWARYVPGAEHLISGKVKKIFKQMKDI